MGDASAFHYIEINIYKFIEKEIEFLIEHGMFDNLMNILKNFFIL